MLDDVEASAEQFAEELEQIAPTNTVEEFLKGDGAVIDQLVATAGEDLFRPVMYWQVIDVVLAVILGWILAVMIRRVYRKRKLQADAEAKTHPDLDQSHSLWDSIKKGTVELCLGLMWPVFSLFFMLIITSTLRFLEVFPNRPLPIDSAAWLILCAYIVIRVIMFAIHQTISKGKSTTRLEKGLAFIIWLGVALQILGILPIIATDLKSTRLPIGNSEVSLWTMLMAVITIAIALFVCKWISNISESWIMSLSELDNSVKQVLTRIMKVTLYFIAILVGLAAVGIDITVLGVFSGAIGVGVGFGLQKIASNYISGFIILLERSVRMGDLISVDGVLGIVTDIKTRYTVVKAFDGTVTIVPNESLIADKVTNTSYLRGPVRASVVISVDYSSDVEHCLDLMVEILRKEPRVLIHPEPHAHLSNFGDSGIDLTGYFWVSDPENGTAGLKSNINRKLLKKFNEENISIPFPQMDLHLIDTPQIACKFETGELPKDKPKEPDKPDKPEKPAHTRKTEH